jgi:hypothetical protein
MAEFKLPKSVGDKRPLKKTLPPIETTNIKGDT